MVETPFPPQAARRLCHAPRRYQKGKNLPMRAVQIVDIREAGQTQAGSECAQRKEDGARQRFLPEPENVGVKAHNLSLYRGGAGVGRSALQKGRALIGPALKGHEFIRAKTQQNETGFSP